MAKIIEIAEHQKRKLLKVPANDTLSFVKRRKPKGTGFDYWDVKPTGDYGRDWKLGARLGDEYLAYIGQYPTFGTATLLGCIVRDMLGKGDAFEGVELGFLRQVNSYAMSLAASMKVGEAL